MAAATTAAAHDTTESKSDVKKQRETHLKSFLSSLVSDASCQPLLIVLFWVKYFRNLHNRQGKFIFLNEQQSLFKMFSEFAFSAVAAATTSYASSQIAFFLPNNTNNPFLSFWLEFVKL